VLADQKDAGALRIAGEYGVKGVFVDPVGTSARITIEFF